MQFLEWVKL